MPSDEDRIGLRPFGRQRVHGDLAIATRVADDALWKQGDADVSRHAGGRAARLDSMKPMRELRRKSPSLAQRGVVLAANRRGRASLV